MRLFDFGALVLAFPLACEAYEALARATAWIPPMNVLWPGFALVVAAWGASAWLNQLYGAFIGRSPLAEIVRVLRTAATAALGVVALCFLTKQTHVSRLLVGMYFALVVALTVGIRIGWRLAARATRGGGAARRYAVVGTGAMAREVVEAVEANPEWGLSFAGFIRIDGQTGGSRGPFLGTVAQLGRTLDEEVLDMVVFAVPRERLGSRSTSFGSAPGACASPTWTASRCSPSRGRRPTPSPSASSVRSMS